MAKKVRIIITLTLAIILLAVTLTSGWMLQLLGGEFNFLNFDYGANSNNSLVISPREYEISILTEGSDGELMEENGNLSIDNLVPASVKTFRIRIKNHSGTTGQLKITMANVSAELVTEKTEEKTGTLLDVIFISVRGGTGYIGNNTVTTPTLYMSLNQNYVYSEITETYNIELFSNLQVPSTEGEGYVELNCYFYLEPEVGLEYQNKQFTIGAFRAE